jgi:hypothetical protein
MSSVLTECMAHLIAGLRALAFVRLSPQTASTGFRTVAFMIALVIAVDAASERLTSGGTAGFDAQGLSAVIAGWALFAILVHFLRTDKRPFDAASLITTSAASTVWIFAFFASAQLLLGHWLVRLGVPEGWLPFAGAVGGILIIIWQLVAYWRIGRAATLGMPRRLGIALPVVALLPMFVLPQKPIFADPSTAFEMPTIWDAVKLWPAAQNSEEPLPRIPRLDVEAAWERQPALVAQALAGLAPSRPGIPEVYVVGAATFAEQDVFKREVSQARDIMDERLDARGRSVLLVNHRDTVEQMPLANATNLGKVIAGVGKFMDTEKDVLVLFVTSHGSQGSISVMFPRFGFNDLTPEGLAGMLDKAGIKKRVVILSACHSGSFISALEGPGTLVMTAAHAEKTSFGCSNEREWTHFGDALFNHALRTTHSLPEAFRLAREKIATWEKEQKLTPSEPQISMGVDIAISLKAIEQRLVAMPVAAPATGSSRSAIAADGMAAAQ